MRYSIAITPILRPLFRIFGFSPARSYVELDEQALTIRYGSVNERIPLAEIGTTAYRHWPFFFGLGAKIGPDKGVSYVGRRTGVIRIDLRHPRPMPVWGPFHVSKAHCVLVSLEDPAAFIADLQAVLQSQRSAAS